MPVLLIVSSKGTNICIVTANQSITHYINEIRLVVNDVRGKTLYDISTN